VKEKQAKNQGNTKDHVIIKGKYKEHKTKISITFAITNNLRPWDFCCPASNIARRPTPDLKLVKTSLGNHPTPLSLKKR
jgi:hypothetical protein